MHLAPQPSPLSDKWGHLPDPPGQGPHLLFPRLPPAPCLAHPRISKLVMHGCKFVFFPTSTVRVCVCVCVCGFISQPEEGENLPVGPHLPGQAPSSSLREWWPWCLRSFSHQRSFLWLLSRERPCLPRHPTWVRGLWAWGMASASRPRKQSLKGTHKEVRAEERHSGRHTPLCRELEIQTHLGKSSLSQG